MTTLSQLQAAPTANAGWIDALIQDADLPKWNYLAPFRTTLYYTFSVFSGTEAATYGATIAGLQAFNATQQAAAREILNYVSRITGIVFSETSNGLAADLHFATCDIEGERVTGVNRYYAGYSYLGDTISTYTPESFIYLDNIEFSSQNAAPAAGNDGYETLLHEVGHALGLKHPFEGTALLPAIQDNTANTVMSYTDSGGPHATFQQMDLAALAFLYGCDGLGGTWGFGSGGAYYQGTAGDESFTSGSGNHLWIGLGGTDLVSFPGTSQSYNFSLSSDGTWLTVHGNGSHDFVAADIETLKFSNTSLTTSGIRGTLATGNTSPSRLGTASDDRFTSLAGNETIDGGRGTDSVSYGSARAGYKVTQTATGYRVVDTLGNGGTDTLIDIEQLQFADQTLNLGQLERINKYYVGYYGRPGASTGVDYWLGTLNNQFQGDESQLVWNFGNTQQPEFVSLYGSGTSVENFVTRVYNNLFNRTPAQSGLTYWQGIYDDAKRQGQDDNAIRGKMVTWIMDGAANSAAYLDRDTLANKVVASSAFTAAIDTNTELTGYRNPANTAALDYARHWLQAINSDGASLATHIDGTIIDQAIISLVGLYTS